jgi:hypothetical protein
MLAEYLCFSRRFAIEVAQVLSPIYAFRLQIPQFQLASFCFEPKVVHSSSAFPTAKPEA